ncbi:DNA polymerase III subunit chi [Qipengyuania sp. JC766]|uniref:DNA polymerase III subunit chi n=1 Tax=Qipengyuania sp. JC766 TaxID=3232139 RepID=UPI00345B0DA8
MRVDFYQLSRDPVERVIPLIARKVLERQDRLLVVSKERDQLSAINEALWSASGSDFLANGFAQEPHPERQPILLSEQAEAVNGAKIAILADGVWREEAASLDRILLMFGEAQTQAARDLWRAFGMRDEAETHIFKQRPDGGWKEGR